VKSLIDGLAGATPLGRAFALVVVVAALFAAAWLISRIAERVATYFVDRSERRRSSQEVDTGVLSSLRQRETAIALIATTVRYAAFGLAVVLSVVALSGAQRIQTIVGASFIAILIAFAAQRFLTDVMAGLLMYFEGWFRIGDTVAIDTWNLQGVVESFSLRSLTLRSVQGEIVHVPNSQVLALRVIPRGFRQAEVEFFAGDLEAGKHLVEQVARIVPVGATRFVRRPELFETERLDEGLYRITARCAVAVGREWLAQDFLPDLLKERAPDGLIVHGPIVTFVDDDAVRSFARAVVTAPRRSGRPSRRSARAGAPPAEAPSESWPVTDELKTRP
jgi:mechanosensitive ion channel-like protein